MGVCYVVRPLDSPMIDWARQCGTPLTGDEEPAREPTLDELRDAVAALADHEVTVALDSNDFQIRAASRETVRFALEGQFANTVAPGVAEAPASHLTIDGDLTAEGVVTLMSVRGNGAAMVTLLQALTRTCGPQVIMGGDDGIPYVVRTPESVPEGPTPWWGDLPEEA